MSRSCRLPPGPRCPAQVTYRDADGQDYALPNDQVFVFPGRELPTKLPAGRGHDDRYQVRRMI